MRQWLRCLLGRHEWVELACEPDSGGRAYQFCLWCGKR